MADNTAVNSQVTDSVTQTNSKVITDASAMALSSIYQAMAHSTGILFENAVTTQQNMNVIAQAATTQGITLLYAIDTAAGSISTSKISDELPPK
ncbi:RebB family R body protein [Fluviicola sp.]|uniref:RebB family R body protein n=1 Tax=Fluviicola sp. TaxID=1917219 RepID=UPI0031CE197D